MNKKKTTPASRKVGRPRKETLVATSPQKPEETISEEQLPDAVRWASEIAEFRADHTGRIQAFTEQAMEQWSGRGSRRPWSWRDQEFRILINRLALEVEHYVGGLISMGRVQYGPHKEIGAVLREIARQISEEFLDQTEGA